MQAKLFRICRLSFLPSTLLFAGLHAAQAQQPIGTVGIQDATVAGALEVTNGRAVLVGNATVTARDHTAEVSLNRGGSVHVCSTSGLHVSSGKSDAGASPLMLALDRGAIEVQMSASIRDVVMTPDLRFTLGSDGPLDLQLRVTRNGDTCVDNRGAKAPVLHVADQFGEGTYELQAGQHVLFEHGSLKEVVDHESSACGCPADPGTSIADALLKTGISGNSSADTAAKTAAEEHPFPAAVSAGLASPTIPQTSAGVIHSQVSATLSSDGGTDSVTAPSSPPPAPVSQSSAGGTAADTAQPPASRPPSKGLFHTVGRFFRRIFGGS